MQKLQSQGVHHITLVGAKPSDVDRLLGGSPRDGRSSFEQPNLDNPGESPPLLRSGRRARLNHRLHERGSDRQIRRAPRPTPVASITSRISLSKADLRPGRSRRLEARGIEHSGVKDRGFMDSIYFDDPLGLTIELAALSLRAAAWLHPRRRPCSRRNKLRVCARRPPASRRPISPTRSKIFVPALAGRRCPTIARPKNPY